MVDAPPGVPEPTTLPKKPITKTEDPINPSHYKGATDLQVIDVIEMFGLENSFCLATAIKYILRAGKKQGAPIHQDVEKAIWYLNRFNQTQRNSND